MALKSAREGNKNTSSGRAVVHCSQVISHTPSRLMNTYLNHAYIPGKSSSEFRPFELLSDQLQAPLLSQNETARNKIPSPSPIGIGTPDVESLQSYLLRIAQLLSLRHEDLITELIAPEVRRLNGLMMSNSRLDDDCVAAIENLTNRSNLRFLTTSFWANSIDDLSRQHSAWCPDCFDEWKKEEKILWQPLKWSLLPVTICLKHQRRLSNRCPHCWKGNFVISSHSRIGYCPACMCWLGNTYNTKYTEKPLSREEIAKQKWVHTNIGLLVSKTPSIYSSVSRKWPICDYRTTKRRGFHHGIYKGVTFLYNSKLIQKFVNKFFEGEIDRFASTFNLSMKRACDIYSHALPSLKEYLDFSYYIKVPTLNFITDGFSQPTPNQIKLLRKEKLIPAGFSAKPLDLKKLRARADYLIENGPPYPLKEAALQLGLSKSLLKRLFPTISQMIKEIYSAYQQLPRFDLISKARRQCVFTINNYFSVGKDPYFYQSVCLYRDHFIEYKTIPLILEWFITMRKLGYKITLRQDHDGYCADYRSLFDNEDSLVTEHFPQWTREDWIHDFRYARGIEARFSRK